jgi:hypothetical protein
MPMRQNFDIVINGGHRRLKAGEVRDMLLQAYSVFYQDDGDYLEPKIDVQQVTLGEMNEV